MVIFDLGKNQIFDDILYNGSQPNAGYKEIILLTKSQNQRTIPTLNRNTQKSANTTIFNQNKNTPTDSKNFFFEFYTPDFISESALKQCFCLRFYLVKIQKTFIQVKTICS